MGYRLGLQAWTIGLDYRLGLLGWAKGLAYRLVAHASP